MIVTTWNNGAQHQSGAGYGIKIPRSERDRYFRKNWKVAYLQLPDNPTSVAISLDNPSFWNDSCRELRSQEIGRWLLHQKLAPWPKVHPPKPMLEPLGETRFSLRKL